MECTHIKGSITVNIAEIKMERYKIRTEGISEMKRLGTAKLPHTSSIASIGIKTTAN